jgi:hypothetical protein
MKLIPILLLALLSFSACSTTPPSGQAFAVTAKTDIQTALNYHLVQTGASVACSSVLQFGISDPQERADIAADLYDIGSVINGLASGGVVTPTQLQKAITDVAPKSPDFSVLATTFQGLYAGIYPQLGGDGQLCVQVLQQLAAGASSAALVYVQKSPVPVPSPQPQSLRRKAHLSRHHGS